LLPQLSPVNVVTALNRLAKCGCSQVVAESDVFTQLLARGAESAMDPAADTRSLANMAWALSSLL